MQASHEDSLTEHVPIRRVHDRRPLAAACPAALELDLGAPPYTVESSRANQAG